MSYKGDQCGTGLCVTPAPTACSTVRHVHEVHTYEVVPRKTRKRLPWMQPWGANSVPYKAGSLVIHCNEYWYNLCESYSPPGENGDWYVFDPEEFFRWFHENARGGCNTLAIPVYAREIGCAARDEDPYCASTDYKLWSTGDVVTGADGKVYVSLVDNNATFPPNTGWSAGRALEDLVRDYVLGRLTNVDTPTPTPTPTPSPTPTPAPVFDRVLIAGAVVDISLLTDVAVAVTRPSADLTVAGNSITVNTAGLYDVQFAPQSVLQVNMDSTVSGIGLDVVTFLHVFINGIEYMTAGQNFRAPSTTEMPGGLGTAFMTAGVNILSYPLVQGDVITLKANVGGKVTSMEGNVRFTARRVA